MCGVAQTDEEQIIQTMEKWNEAVLSKEIDAIVKFYSDNFTSLDVEGKAIFTSDRVKKQIMDN